MSGEKRGTRGDARDESEVLLRDAQRETRRANRLVTIPLLLLIVGAIAMAWWTWANEDTAAEGARAEEQTEEAAAPELTLESQERADSEGEPVAAAEPTGDPDADDGADSDDPDGAETSLVVSVLPEPPTAGLYVDATLSDNVFLLSGVVPTDAHRAALEARAELAYAPFATSELVVDQSVDAEAWLDAAPEVIGLLPMITDGTIRLQDGEVILVGRSPNREYAANFEQTVGGLIGLPVSVPAIEITDLEPPRFVASVDNGQVTLEGELPSAALAENFVLGASAVYGPDNVTSSMTIDEGTYTSFWNYTMPGIFQLLAPFPSYQIQVENGVTSGTMQGGILFGLDSAEVTPEAAEVLAIGVAMLARDRSLEMTVTGHTDDLGPDDLNQRLSLARAQSVVDFFVSAGVDVTRLTAVGVGSAEPLAANDTPERRSQNRRVEFAFD